MSKSTLKRRVQKGMKLLDNELPPKWRQKIDLAQLSLSSSEACVLGQLYGSYEDGLLDLDIDNAEARKRGFLLTGKDEADYYKLTELWKLALSA